MLSVKKKADLEVFVFLALLVFAGCKSEPSSDAPAGADAKVADSTAKADSSHGGDSLKAGDVRPLLDGHLSRDGSMIKAVYVAPLFIHLFTNIDPATTVDLTYTRHLIDQAQAESEIQSAFELLALPGKTKVAGVLKMSSYGPSGSGKFTPASALATDTDYAIHLKKGTYLYPTREYTLFRVGSMPRVMRIRFNALDIYASVLKDVHLVFSELVDKTTAAAAIKVEEAATGSALTTTLSPPNPVNLNLTLKLSGNLPLTKKVRLTVGVDVGSKTGAKLDGKYTFVPGSGPLVVELVPASYTTTDWVPTVTF